MSPLRRTRAFTKAGDCSPGGKGMIDPLHRCPSPVPPAAPSWYSGQLPYSVSRPRLFSSSISSLNHPSPTSHPHLVSNFPVMSLHSGDHDWIIDMRNTADHEVASLVKEHRFKLSAPVEKKIVATAMALADKERGGQPPHRIDGGGAGCRGDGAACRPLVSALLCAARQEKYAGVGVATWHGLGGWVGTLAAAVYCKGGGEGIKGRVKSVAAVKVPLEAVPAVRRFEVGVVEAACEILAGMLSGCAAGHRQMRGDGMGRREEEPWVGVGVGRQVVVARGGTSSAARRAAALQGSCPWERTAAKN